MTQSARRTASRLVHATAGVVALAAAADEALVADVAGAAAPVAITTLERLDALATLLQEVLLARVLAICTL
jgi:hypothetical protein